ncbi:MAG: TldD/PmbA family protein [Candidatus Lokiarchaeota archaeon]|nr:TldD/PmbA family protein [Candidatus Lokiarchaeota archaeon]MBD3202649.1 TldD/PmbA family protein [Candidatus Lokiarchaeota archaeon]
MKQYKDLAEFALEKSLQKPCEYAEVRIEENKSDTLSFLNGKMHIGNLPIDLTTDAFSRKIGINVRILANGGIGMATTNQLSKESVMKAIDFAYKMANKSGDQRKNPIKLSNEKTYEVSWQSKYKINPIQVPLEEKVEFIQQFLDLFNEDYPIEYLHIFVLLTEERNTYFINSDGSAISSHVPRVAFMPVIIGIQSGGKNEQLMNTYATTSGWDELMSWSILNEVRESIHTLANIITKAKRPPEGEIDLILGPRVSGIISHENCGHPHEADRIRGREGAQAGESYLRQHEVGFQIGNECVNVYDDPTEPGSYGFYLYDDEGVKARRRELIKNGKFNEMLHNRETAGFYGTKSNGAARAVSYDREPLIRMANTYFAPGDFSFEEMIEDIKLGVYMKSFTEWNIDDKRLQSKYVGQEAYLIENGEIKDLILKPALEISSIGLFSSVDAQGDQKSMQWEGAFCGKSEPGQGCPVWTGGPNIRLRNIKLARGQ